MPALPSSAIDALFSQFEALLPTPADAQPLGCRRPRVPDRVVFNKLITRLVLGGSYVLTGGNGLPIGVILAGANWHDSPLLRPTLECLSRFEFFLPESIQVDLDSGYDSHVIRDLLDELGRGWKISPKGTYIVVNHTRRWKAERTNSWHTRGFTLLQVVLDRADRVQQAWCCMANAIIVLSPLLKEAWPRFHWSTRPIKQFDWR